MFSAARGKYWMSNSLRLPVYQMSLVRLPYLVVVPHDNHLPERCLVFCSGFGEGDVWIKVLLHGRETCSPLFNCSLIGKLCGVRAIMLTGRLLRPYSLSCVWLNFSEWHFIWNGDKAYLSWRRKRRLQKSHFFEVWNTFLGESHISAINFHS